MLRDRWFFGRKTRHFTLQWHLTNTCRFHCRHCYDRTPRGELALDEALRVLTGLTDFARRRHVQPQICLTGGDPLCHPDFWELYAAIARQAIPVSILGNPIPRTAIERLQQIQPPLYYQVSLEGLREHNDTMRGTGHYDQTLEFLATARDLGLRTHVMLTLTRANLDQVVPLGEALRLLTCRLTFNRVAQVGEATDLAAPSKEEFVSFLKDYLAGRRQNPVFGVKDNLLNIVRHHFGRSLYPGCTGCGCGAAFNFVALLPDGEVHACRKFPSPLGHLRQRSLAAIYDSSIAAQYRHGPSACRGCPLRNSCSGCPAVAYGQGLNPLQDRDPHCFLPERAVLLANF
jgi:selenobiotic family peptide radical SAM maturase